MRSESQDEYNELLTFDELEARFGIRADFLSLAEKCGFSPDQKKASLRALCDWLEKNYVEFKRCAELWPAPPLKETASEDETTKYHRRNALLTFSEFAARVSDRKLNWPLWKKSVEAVFGWQPKGSNPEEVIYKHKPFLPCFEDAIWCCLEAQANEQQLQTQRYTYLRRNVSRFSHLSILSSALALEAAANCALDSLEPRGQTTKDIDKLSLLGKLDIYLMSRGTGHILDRGSKLIQPIVEIIGLRNSAAHPKIESNRRLLQSDGCYIAHGQLLPHLQIPDERYHDAWNSEHAIKVLRAICSFLTDYFLGSCQHRPIEMRRLLFDEGFVEGKPTHQYSPEHTNQIQTAIKEWKLDNRFLCPWVGKNMTVGKEILFYEPGYPEDILVRREPVTW